MRPSSVWRFKAPPNPPNFSVNAAVKCRQSSVCRAGWRSWLNRIEGERNNALQSA